MSSLTRMYFYLKILMHLLTYCICISQTYDIVLFASFLISHGFLDRGSFRISPAWIRAIQWPVLVVNGDYSWGGLRMLSQQVWHDKDPSLLKKPVGVELHQMTSQYDTRVFWHNIIASWTEWQFFFFF